MQKYPRPFLILGLAATMLLAACGDDGDEPAAASNDEVPSTGSSSEEALPDIELTVGANNVGTYLTALRVGIERDIYEDCGISIQFEGFTSSADTLRALTTGDLDISASTTSANLAAVMAGQPIRSIGGVYQGTSRISYIVPPDSEISGPEDMAGKKVGVTSINGSAHTLLLHALREAGVDTADVEVIAVGAIDSGLVALDSGTIDVSWASYPLLAGLGDDYEVILEVDDYVTDYQQVEYIVTESWASGNMDAIERFLECTDDANAYIAENAEEAGATFGEIMEVDPAFMKDTVEYTTGRDEFTTTVNKAGITFNLNALKAEGLIDEDVTLDSPELEKYFSIANDLGLYR
jgi:ABC-type nitrate/sulfonate/bicarbonate transport system substrate-binding protein